MSLYHLLRVMRQERSRGVDGEDASRRRNPPLVTAALVLLAIVIAAAFITPVAYTIVRFGLRRGKEEHVIVTLSALAPEMTTPTGSAVVVTATVAPSLPTTTLLAPEVTPTGGSGGSSNWIFDEFDTARLNLDTYDSCTDFFEKTANSLSSGSGDDNDPGGSSSSSWQEWRFTPNAMGDSFWELDLSERYKDYSFMEPPAPDGAAAPESSSAPLSGGTAASSLYSATNVQVAGIDEADVVKTDGNNIYAVGGQQLIIVSGNSDKTVVTRLNLDVESMYLFYAAEDILLVQDRVIVLAVAQIFKSADTGEGISTVLATVTVAQTFDLSDISNPLLIGIVTLEGKYTTARLVGDHVYLVASSQIRNPTVAQPMPEVWPTTEDQWESVDLCSNVMYIPEISTRSLILLASISTQSGTLVAKKMMATAAEYGKPDVMTVADSMYVSSENPCTSDDGSCNGQLRTGIVAFNINGTTGIIELRAMGAVPGKLLSQWSMDDYDGHLRVAYTLRQCTNDQNDFVTVNECATQSRIDILSKSNLVMVGRLENLGIEEEIKAVRFQEELGVIVTFRVIDPFYTVDLTVPSAPVVLGELKITGFSSYLHFIDKDTVLGIGHAGNDEGQLTGMKIALFDISNRTDPQQTATYEIGGQGTTSQILSDHRALLYDPTNQLIAIPTREYDEEGMCLVFNGLRVLGINTINHAFELLASLEHAPATYTEDGFLLYDNAEASGCHSNACGAATIYRTLYIGDRLFSVSDSEIRSINMGTWEEDATVTPMFEREELALDGTCTSFHSGLGEHLPVLWSDVAKVWAHNETTEWTPQCYGAAGNTMTRLLSGAGGDPPQYNSCMRWY